jgi:hypothetical protein
MRSVSLTHILPRPVLEPATGFTLLLTHILPSGVFKAPAGAVPRLSMLIQVEHPSQCSCRKHEGAFFPVAR